jgi:hypothetical protein
MSALWAPIAGRRDDIATVRRPLRAVAEPAARLARFPYLLVLIGIFGIGMAGLLMLNTTLQGQAFQSRTLNRQATELAYAQADLENQLDALAAPQELARRASALGMRPNPYPAFLVLPSGKVIGKPTPVQGHEVPAFIVKTPAEIAAERAAKRARVEAKAAAQAAKREQQKADQSKTKQTKSKQTKAKQSKTNQSKTNRTKANRTKVDRSTGTTNKGTDREGRRH